MTYREEEKKKKGCWKGCLTGFLAVVLLLVLLVIGTSIVLWRNRERVTTFLFDQTERAALSVFAEAGDRKKVEEAVAEIREAWKKGEMDPEKLEKAVWELKKCMADGGLNKEEVEKLMEMFRGAIRGRAPAIP